VPRSTANRETEDLARCGAAIQRNSTTHKACAQAATTRQCERKSNSVKQITLSAEEISVIQQALSVAAFHGYANAQNIFAAKVKTISEIRIDSDHDFINCKIPECSWCNAV
jgi:hypothetical protein